MCWHNSPASSCMQISIKHCSRMYWWDGWCLYVAKCRYCTVYTLRSRTQKLLPHPHTLTNRPVHSQEQNTEVAASPPHTHQPPCTLSGAEHRGCCLTPTHSPTALYTRRSRTQRSLWSDRPMRQSRPAQSSYRSHGNTAHRGQEEESM